MDKLPKTIEELPIKFFKLMNGDSIISYTHDLDNEYCIGLEEPMYVDISSDNNGYLLSPWIPFSSGRVHILENLNIIIDSPVDSHMKAKYMRLVLKTLGSDDNISDDIDTSDKVLH